MNETITTVRLIYIIAGFLAFVVAPAALVTARSGAAYWRWGKLYFWALAIVAFTAIILAVWRPIEWLALLALSSFLLRVLRLTRALPKMPATMAR